MKQRIRYLLGTGFVRVVSVAVLAFLTLAAILYQKEYYDFTFFERKPLPDYSAEEEPQDTAPAVPQQPDKPADTGDIGEDPSVTPVTDPAGTGTETAPGQPVTPTEPVTVTAKTVIDGLMKTWEAKNKGYTAQTGGIYAGNNWILADLNLAGLPVTYSYSDYQTRTLVTTEYERGCFWTEETTKTTERPAVMLKNGCIILDKSGGKLTLKNLDGNDIILNYDEKKLALTEYRTPEGEPVFVTWSTVKEKVHLPIMRANEFTGRMEESGEFEEAETEVETTKGTYYIIGEKNKLVEIDITAKELDRGLLFDMPADYGDTDCDIERYLYGAYWGYRIKSTGKVIVYPRYRRAYNYHDGYAICFDDYNMYILDMQGKAVYSAGCDKPEVFATFNELTYPDTNGIETLGSYYVSHGLTRVRLRRNLVTYRVYYYIKEEDVSVLIDTEGREFALPAGYELQSYSDGLICLKKQDGQIYGFMNYKGEWVVQPEYRYAGPFLSGLAVLQTTDRKYGLIDETGAWVLPPVFDEISDVSMGAVAVYDKETGWHVLRCMKK